MPRGKPLIAPGEDGFIWIFGCPTVNFGVVPWEFPPCHGGQQQLIVFKGTPPWTEVGFWGPCTVRIQWISHLCLPFELFWLAALKSYLKWANSMALGAGILPCVPATAPGTEAGCTYRHRIMKISWLLWIFSPIFCVIPLHSFLVKEKKRRSEE